MNIRIFSVLLILIMTVPAILPASREANRQKYLQCENYCRLKYRQCRTRVGKMEEGPKKRKAAGICNTFFNDCMGRCRRYRR
jgi:hypothetical protein